MATTITPPPTHVHNGTGTEGPRPTVSTVAAPTPTNVRRSWFLLIIAMALVFVGGALAGYVQTDGGNVQVRDIRFVGSNGTLMSALLYVPKGVTDKNPAPGIVAIYGYINSRETQDGFAIEFARRGFVVLAPDQTGHGYSDPPAMVNGFGGPDSLRYLRTLSFVDPTNIGLEGHSMGGWAVAIAAGVYSTSYQSIVLEGSSTGTYGAPDGTPTWPRNLALVFSQYDEFSQLMWGSQTARGIVDTQKLQTLFNTTSAVVPGQVYGSIADGTARVLYQPATTHPGDHISTAAIGNAISWFQQTLKGGNTLPASDQIWYWKEIGTLIALIGAIMFIFPFGALLLALPFFSSLRRPVPGGKGMGGIGWWVAAALTILIPAVTFYSFQHFSDDHFIPNAIWPQSITNGVATWALGGALITIVLFLVWHFGMNRRAGGTFADYGVTWPGRGIIWSQIGKSVLLALSVFSGFYLLLVLSDWAFKTDFRIWVVAVKQLDPTQLRIYLAYVLFFILYSVVVGLALHGELRGGPAGDKPVSLARAMWVNLGLMIGGVVLLLLFQYVPLFLNDVLGNTSESLLGIVAIQFLAVLGIVGLISTYFYYKTGRIWTGAVINGLLITLIVVAGTATQFAI